MRINQYVMGPVRFSLYEELMFLILYSDIIWWKLRKPFPKYSSTCLIRDEGFQSLCVWEIHQRLQS